MDENEKGVKRMKGMYGCKWMGLGVSANGFKAGSSAQFDPVSQVAVKVGWISTGLWKRKGQL